MKNSDRPGQLFDSLGMEIVAAQAGSTQGQFPILDQFANLRDEAAVKPGWMELHTRFAQAWERMVQIVRRETLVPTEARSVANWTSANSWVW